MSKIEKIKRLLVICCIIIFILLIVFITIRNKPVQLTDEQIVQNIELYKSYISYDSIFSIKTPSTWTEVKEKYTLNKNAVLELHNEQKNAYLVVVTINKLDTNDSFEQFKKDVFTQKETHYNITINEYKDVVVNNYSSQYIEFYNTNSDQINTYIRSYAIETKNHYVQIMLWTLKSNKDKIQQEFNNIIDNFKEIELS